MIFRIGSDSSNTQIFLPIFLLNDKRFLEFPLSSLIILEILLHLLSLYFVIKVLYVSIKIHAFHRNMSFLIFFWNINWFQMVIANLIIKPYEIGLISLSGVDNVLTEWEVAVDNKNDIKHVRSDLDSATILFFIGGFLKLNYIILLISGLLLLSIERSFACFLLTDYEKTSRNFILIGLLISYYVISTVFSVFWFLYPLEFFGIMGILLIPNLVALVVSFMSENVF